MPSDATSAIEVVGLTDGVGGVPPVHRGLLGHAAPNPFDVAGWRPSTVHTSRSARPSMSAA